MGYKVHFSESCDDDKPHLITQVLTTNATQQDFDTLNTIHERLQARDLLPKDHLVDMGYLRAAAVRQPAPLRRPALGSGGGKNMHGSRQRATK
ncbi:MAG: hypothetical protein U0694_20560 [Anaerolineae bacterium]